MYLFTRMKSPTSSVGFMDPDGILNGSTQKERITNTTTITGKKARAMSTTTGSGSPSVRRLRAHFASQSQITPVITAASSSTAAKSVNLSSSPITAMKSTGHATSSRPLRVSERGLPRARGHEVPPDDRGARRRGDHRDHFPVESTLHLLSSAVVEAAPMKRLLLDLENGQERLLGDLHAAHLLHALLAGLLLLEQLPLARDVAAVALGEHVLP